MFMEAFATGFSMSSDTKPGFCIENDNYKIGLEGALCDQTKNIVSRGFENCYSWREVMELILDATEEAAADNLIDIEEAAEDAMREWLVTFKGWGLLSSILDSKIHRHVVLSLAYTSSNWDMDTGGEFTEEKVFDTVKYVYDNIPGKELHSLVPKFGIWFEEIVEGDLAAEAAVKDIMIEEDIDELDIPETLFEVVRDKFCDAEWVRSFWSAKLEVDKEKEGSDVAGGNLDKDDGEVHQLNVDNIGVDDEVHNEEFLASVIDELSSDVEHVLDGDLEPDFHEDVSNNVEQEVKNIHGIDGLLSIWVFIFMILGIVAYIWC
eukprot:GFUD01076734.1.p1 GENE.GFUD01076734.1~~GFUD01076734.1.p1  ORF type:complete len:320 (-),score=84.29 GFUD01076734.1:35-994(-)